MVIRLHFCKPPLATTVHSNVIRAGKVHFENVTFKCEIEPCAQSLSCHFCEGLGYTCEKKLLFLLVLTDTDLKCPLEV